MITPQLIDYIKEQIKQGVSNKEIKQVLLDAGWRELDIDEAFNQIGVFGYKVQPAAKPIKRSNVWSILLVIFLSLILIGVIVYGGYYFLQKYF
ncbi:MAG: hypothetical protein ACPLW9_01700 [Minisyncoccales bacterium]